MNQPLDQDYCRRNYFNKKTQIWGLTIWRQISKKILTRLRKSSLTPVSWRMKVEKYDIKKEKIELLEKIHEGLDIEKNHEIKDCLECS